MSKVRVVRKAYYRKPYRRADGVYVKGGYVKRASFLVDSEAKLARKSKGKKTRRPGYSRLRIKKAPK